MVDCCVFFSQIHPNVCVVGMGRWTTTDYLTKDSRSRILGGFTSAVEVTSLSLGSGEVDTRFWANAASDSAASASSDDNSSEKESFMAKVGR